MTRIGDGEGEEEEDQEDVRSLQSWTSGFGLFLVYRGLHSQMIFWNAACYMIRSGFEVEYGWGAL